MDKKEKLKELYRKFSRAGQLLEARNILRLLRNKTLTLGLNDTDWNTEMELEREGFKLTYGRNFNTARISI